MGGKGGRDGGEGGKQLYREVIIFPTRIFRQCNIARLFLRKHFNTKYFKTESCDNRIHTCPRASAENGVSSEGFKTTLHPAARAAPALRVTMATGKFHGVTSAATPTGCLATSIRLPLAWSGRMSPSIRLASSENQSRNEALYVTSTLASWSTLPCSESCSNVCVCALCVCVCVLCVCVCVCVCH